MSEPRSLKSIFESAEKAAEANDVEAALESYGECLQIISKMSLFSDNEGLEDISTSDLPFLLVSYRVAEVLQKLSVASPVERISALNTTRDAYEKFLHLLDSYSLLSDADVKFFETYNEDPEAFSTISTTDGEARRSAKIANFRQEKQLKQKLEYMRQSPRYLEDGGDEEAVREVHLANIAYCAHMAFQGLEGINRELELLALAPVPLIPAHTTIQEDERHRKSTNEGDGQSSRLDHPLKRLQSAFSGPLLSKSGKPLRPFTLTSDRQELQKGVFRPGHNLPTMSIDEYLEEERRRGGIIEGGGEASGRQATPDEDNYEKADAATMKARDWDEFTEENPKGAGNTLNRG